MTSPTTIRLPLFFDAAKLQADLARFAPEEWICHSMHEHHARGWRVLPLRSRGGSITDWTPGTGFSKEPYLHTPYLSRAPHFQDVLGTFDCDVNSARLSGVPAGGHIDQHRDSDSSGRVLGSQVRLHIPIRTHPNCRLYIEQHCCDWRPGELWWGDFTKPHRVENKSDVFRVHLLICVVANAWLLSLFEAATTPASPVR